MAIEFSLGAGQYRDTDTGRFVSRARLQRLVDQEARSLSVQLEREMQRFLDGEITSIQYSQNVRAAMKPSVIRTTVLMAGGQNAATSQVYGMAGNQLRQAYARMNNLLTAIDNGEVTRGQALQRSRDLSLAVKQAASKSEQITKANAGFLEGWRRLDPLVRHCNSCPAYATGDWVPITEIVPVGTACECGGRCRCTIVYRRGEGGLNQVEQLAAAVAASNISAPSSVVPLGSGTASALQPSTQVGSAPVTQVLASQVQERQLQSVRAREEPEL